jgi:hypothetical protein
MPGRRRSSSVRACSSSSWRYSGFTIRAGSAEYAFPYAKLRVVPSSDDPIETVFPGSGAGPGGVHIPT